MSQNIHQLVEACRSVAPSGEKLVLATIIHTEGSTYQKAGARMLIRESGELMGILAGGCFEGDLREQAQAVFRDGKARRILYDMRSPDDAVWGLGLGCDGAVHVLLQLLRPDDNYMPVDIFAQVCANQRQGILATVCTSEKHDTPVGQILFLETNMQDGEVVIDCADDLLAALAHQVLLEDKPMLLDYDIDDIPSRIFLDPIKPPHRLLILGAGPDAAPLTQLAAQLGWRITLMDHRPANIKAERFPEAEEVLNIAPSEIKAKISLNSFDALMVMTHSIDYDERYLRQIAGSSIPYIGLLGPAHRREKLLDSLGKLAEKIRGRAFGPAGLDIGANTPEEIALSIMAEIQAVSANRDGGRLYLSNEPLHERTTPN